MRCENCKHWVLHRKEDDLNGCKFWSLHNLEGTNPNTIKKCEACGHTTSEPDNAPLEPIMLASGLKQYYSGWTGKGRIINNCIITDSSSNCNYFEAK